MQEHRFMIQLIQIGGCMKKIIIVIFVTLLLGSCLFLGFKTLKKAPNQSTTNKPSDIEFPEVPIPEPPKPKLKIVDETSNSRPVAVMINNHAQARKNHAGLQDAYLVYEMIVEGGLTRLMAVFKDQTTNRIGSVRSSRHNYLDYALESDAIYVHFGWSPKAQSDISLLGINNINGLYDEAFYRDKTLGVAYEHTAFTSMDMIQTIVKQKGYRTTSDQPLLFNYSIDEIGLETKEGAGPANQVELSYSAYITSSYTYNPEAKVYNRFVNGEIHKDGVTEEQYHFKNIIIANVNNYNLDSYGRQNLDTVGNGTGYFITNGYAVPITWHKDSRISQTKYCYLDGTEIVLNDGNTFIQIFPINKTPDI